jgi:hypothetical protein
LVEENGHFKPSGSCESTFGWALLLFALDIRPGRGILAWRVPTDGADPAESGQISLDIDGQAFCHIVNLYREYTESAPDELSRESEKAVCRMPFGTLSILREEDSKFNVSFQSGTPEELAAPRVPFSYHVWFLPGDRLKFEKEVVVARYYNAIHHGVSDTKAVLPDPEGPTGSLIERTRGLVQSIGLLRGTPGPFLLTASWLEEASRIKRRVSTDGGEDGSLIDAITTALSKMPDVVKRLEYIAGDNWKEWVESALKKDVHVYNRSIPLVWTGRRVSSSLKANAVRAIVRQLLPTVLAQFASTPAGIWRHTLSEMVRDVATLLNTSDRWVNDLGIVLELTPESQMWMADFQIRG